MFEISKEFTKTTDRIHESSQKLYKNVYDFSLKGFEDLFCRLTHYLEFGGSKIQLYCDNLKLSQYNFPDEVKYEIRTSCGELLHSVTLNGKGNIPQQIEQVLNDFRKIEPELCHKQGYLAPSEVDIDVTNIDVGYRECAFVICNGRYKEGGEHSCILSELTAASSMDAKISLAMGVIKYTGNLYVALILEDSMQNITTDEILSIGNFIDMPVYLIKSDTGWLKSL